MMRPQPSMLLLLAAVLSCDHAPEPEADGLVLGGPTCAECRIEPRLLATIHDSDFPDGALGTSAVIQVNPDSTFLVLSGPGLFYDGVYLADRTGSIYRRIGRSGEGPGEYVFPQYCSQTPSSYFVFDPRLLRMTQISKNDLRVERTTRIPMRLTGLSPVAFPDGSYLISTARGMVNIISPEGEVTNTFQVGLDSLSSDPLDPAHFSISGDRSFWVAFRGRHRMEEWHRSGRLLRAIERNAAWVKPRTPESKEGDEFTRIQGIHEDDWGRLWVHYMKHTFREVSRPAVAADGTRTTLTNMTVDRDPSSRETRIEVIDLDELSVLAPLTIPGMWAWPLQGGFHLAVFRTEETIVPMIEVWAFDLEDPPL